MSVMRRNSIVVCVSKLQCLSTIQTVSLRGWHCSVVPLKICLFKGISPIVVFKCGLLYLMWKVCVMSHTVCFELYYVLHTAMVFETSVWSHWDGKWGCADCEWFTVWQSVSWTVQYSLCTGQHCCTLPLRRRSQSTTYVYCVLVHMSVCVAHLSIQCDHLTPMMFNTCSTLSCSCPSLMWT